MKLSTVLLAGFVVLTIALAFKMHQLGQELTEGAQAASANVREAERISRGLIDRIHTLRAPPFSLVGMEATSGQEVAMESVDSLVLFVFGPNCPFSLKSVPFLNKLHAAGVSVVGVAPDKPRLLIEMFAQTSGTTFPLLANPTGDVVEILPPGPVPLTAVFLHGRMETLWLGPLEEDRQQLLEEQFGVDRGKG